jgi:cytochrome c553
MRPPAWLMWTALVAVGAIALAVVLARGAARAAGRGQELAETHGCVGCHSPPNGPALSGYLLGAWLAPNITPDPVSGIGAWSRDDVFGYLRRGRAPGKDQASGPMAAIIEALSQVPDDDLYSLIDWLARQPARRDPADAVPAFARGEPLARDPEVRRGISFAASPQTAASGASLYNTSCASCHGARGAGTSDGYYPPLSHNSTVGRRTPYNLLAVLLFGVKRDLTDGSILMPGFDRQRGADAGLADDELARLANFVVETFGDPAAATIGADNIQTTRAGLWSSGEPSAARGQLIAVSGGGAGADGACFRCHRVDGLGDAAAAFPRLAGLDARYLAKQMDDYRSGVRPNDMMGPIARRLDRSDDQGIALYYAARSERSAIATAAAPDDGIVRLGATLYARGSQERGIQACATCHGPDGRGMNGTYPSIVQAATYTATQLRLWRTGVRRNDYGDIMGAISRRMTEEDIRAVSAYTARFAH